MRGRGPGRKAVRRSWTGEPTEAREELERRWFSRLTRRDDLAALVTGEQSVREPFHRWVSLRQAFAPELVRLFLREAEGLASRPLRLPGGRGRPADLPLLDLFCGSGTFVLECARQGVPARGIEALESLAFLARARGTEEVPDLPDLSGCREWQQVAGRLDLPIHRAALICAVARRHTSSGQPNAGAPPLLELLADVVGIMREDVRTPLGIKPDVQRGDARQLAGFSDGSVGGILTSPPYLSRHDYTKATEPHEMVYRYWYEGRDLTERRQDQVRAHPRSYAQVRAKQMPPSVTEACAVLARGGEGKLAGVVRSYFEDMFTALVECARVLADGCPCWPVVGGARLKDVYVPSDTILAEFAETCGFSVSGIYVARRLTPSGRKFGGLSNVAPRESILLLNKKGMEPSGP